MRNVFMKKQKKLIIGAAIGNCVHIGGIVHFLQLAKKEGYDTRFMGPAVTNDEIVHMAKLEKPSIIALSYRLTPENIVGLLNSLKTQVEQDKELAKIQWVFGGTRPVAEIARKYSMFSYISDGSDDVDDSIAFLRGTCCEADECSWPDDIRERILQKYPYPLLRHHFGLPSFEETRKGIKEIAQSKVLDVISLGPDQNTQQYFFNQENMNIEFDGAGGVPIRTEDDFFRLKEASGFGNHPLMRCYSGTADVMKMAETLKKTINNAWCAVPLCWYNELDGRGPRTIEQSIVEAQKLMQWHAKRNIPVEMNEPHHWGLRDAPDVMSVLMAYIAAYNAKKAGVKHYISQYMFNIPNTLGFSMDLARVLAMVEAVESLSGDQFKTYRQTRAGLPFLSSDLNVAKGQLAASTYLSMNINPHIIHVVGYCEADHAAYPQEVIESCKIVRGVVRSIIDHNASGVHGSEIQERKEELLHEMRYTLDYIEAKYSDWSDPFTSAEVIADCIKSGIIDAPHIVHGGKFKGNIKTSIIDGKCVAWDEKKEKMITEEQRLAQLERLNTRRQERDLLTNGSGTT